MAEEGNSWVVKLNMCRPTLLKKYLVPYLAVLSDDIGIVLAR